eukprot:1176613-Rhodomonas_salina.2
MFQYPGKACCYRSLIFRPHIGLHRNTVGNLFSLPGYVQDDGIIWWEGSCSFNAAFAQTTNFLSRFGRI